MVTISKVLGIGNKIELTRSAAAENIDDAKNNRMYKPDSRYYR